MRARQGLKAAMVARDPVALDAAIVTATTLEVKSRLPPPLASTEPPGSF